MERNEWIEQAKSKLDAYDEKMNELEARAASVKEDARAQYHETLSEAKQHVGHARSKLKEAEKAGKEAWSDTKQTFQESWTKEKEAIESAVAQLTS